MPDDLDDLLRAAMKTLDEQVPSGYFETLPNRTLARLEGSSMQHGSSGTTETRDSAAPPPPLNTPESAPAASARAERPEREEDSGLHDIRNLAQSTKQRLSSRRIATTPPIEDVLASSSGSFKNIALPQPAKMVSLPELDELPSKAEIIAAEKAAAKAAKQAAKEAKAAEAKAAKEAKQAGAEAATAPALGEAQPAVEAPAQKAFGLPSQQRKSNKGLFAVIGIGLAAAAGAVVYVQTTKSADRAAPAESAAKDTVAVAAPAASATVAAPEPPPPPPPAEPAVVAVPDAAAAVAPVAAGDDKDAAEESQQKAAKAPRHKVEKEAPKVEQKKAPEKTEKADKPAKPEPSGEGEPSFDELLKEAGVTEKKETKPKLDKKKLTGADFKAAMDAVEGKAKACYKGTVGNVMVHMTIDPSGKIKKLSVGGPFAGKPEGACVEAAMRTATFPPWDGATQSFSYSVLLSD